MFKIVKEYEENGRMFVIVECNFLFGGIHHNGYMEIPKPKRRKFHHFDNERKYDITYTKYTLNAVELTYSDYGVCMKHLDKYFIGFDTNHFHDTIYTKSMRGVEDKLKELAEEWDQMED